MGGQQQSAATAQACPLNVLYVAPHVCVHVYVVYAVGQALGPYSSLGLLDSLSLCPHCLLMTNG